MSSPPPARVLHSRRAEFEPAFREDLDLCGRAAVAGHDVEVVPAAVGSHAALAAEHRRTGRVAELGPRYLAERNTLTALLMNYGRPRLLVVLPLALGVEPSWPAVIGLMTWSMAKHVYDAIQDIDEDAAAGIMPEK